MSTATSDKKEQIPSLDDYKAQLDKLYQQISARPDFSYRPDADPLYNSYRQSYVQQGSRAMKDSMGQAAALTGGYGSSYSQSAGQQEYDRYLQALNDVLPDLYSMALEGYNSQGQQLYDNYQLLLQQYDSAYEAERDRLEDQRYEQEYKYQQQQNSYRQLYELISSTGYSPSDEELLTAGMTRAQANALIEQYKKENAPRVSYGGGSSYNQYQQQLPVGSMTGPGRGPKPDVFK